MSKSSSICINHHIAELQGVDFELLNDQKKLVEKTHKVAQELKLTILNTFIHRFEPHGLSLVLIISQSHIAIHTWPEHGYMHVDMVTCSESAGISESEKTLQKHFSPIKITSKKINY